MNTLKTTTYLFVFLFCAFSTRAQITMTSADMPAIGTKLNYVTSWYDSLFNPGPSGPNQTWNIAFTSSQVTNSSLEFIAPSTAANASNFTNANLCTKNDMGTEIFYAINSDSFVNLGGGSGSAQAFTKRNIKLFDFPLQYGNQTQSINIDTFRYNNFPVLDSIMVIIKNNSSSVIDAWGNMTTPCGIYNCLRKKNIDSYTDQYFTKINGAWHLDSSNAYNKDFYYEWYADSGRFLIASVSTADSNRSNNLMYQQSCTPLNVANKIGLDKIIISANAANTILHIATTNAMLGKLYVITNTYGAVMHKGIINNNITNVSIEQFTTGMYLLKFEDANTKAIKFLKQ
jgi:hypothetical protein